MKTPTSMGSRHAVDITPRRTRQDFAALPAGRKLTRNEFVAALAERLEAGTIDAANAEAMLSLYDAT